MDMHAFCSQTMFTCCWLLDWHWLAAAVAAAAYVSWDWRNAIFLQYVIRRAGKAPNLPSAGHRAGMDMELLSAARTVGSAAATVDFGCM
jgi:hypothetical protein